MGGVMFRWTTFFIKGIITIIRIKVFASQKLEKAAGIWVSWHVKILPRIACVRLFDSNAKDNFAEEKRLLL